MESENIELILINNLNVKQELSMIFTEILCIQLIFAAMNLLIVIFSHSVEFFHDPFDS